MALRASSRPIAERAARRLALGVLLSLVGCAAPAVPARSAETSRPVSNADAAATSSDGAPEWVDGEATRAPSRTLFEQGSIVVGEPAPPPQPSRPPRVGLVDLDLVNADLTNAARLLADAGHFNVVVEEGLGGSVSANLRRVDPYRALVVLAEAHGAIVVYEDGIVQVRRPGASANRR